MKVVEEVRRARLQALREEIGSLAELNVRLELTRTDSTLSQILNQSKGSKSGKPKTMGSEMARALEASCNKPAGWMDTDPEAGWPFELLTREMFERVSERQKGAIESAALKALRDMGDAGRAISCTRETLSSSRMNSNVHTFTRQWRPRNPQLHVGPLAQVVQIASVLKVWRGEEF